MLTFSLRIEASTAAMREPKTIPKTAPTRRPGTAARFADARLAAGQSAFPVAGLGGHAGWSTTPAKDPWIRLGARVEPGLKELESFFPVLAFAESSPVCKTKRKGHFGSVNTGQNELWVRAWIPWKA